MLAPLRAIPEIALYAAHPGSGLRRLAEADPTVPAPYWAFAWGGGLALARHLLDHPATVAGKRVLDLGAGSGLVGIAAARSGAAAVVAAETNRFGRAAVRLNAAANGIDIALHEGDITEGPLPTIDLVVAGDVFYDTAVAARMLLLLDRCHVAGMDVLVGDPLRPALPTHRLRRIAEYPVGDVGEPARPGFVFELLPPGTPSDCAAPAPE